jgi:hypothetical protein
MESPPTANICKHSTHSRPANPQDDNHTADNHIVVRPHSTSKNRFQWYFFYAPRPAGILLQKRMSPTRRVAVHQKRRNHSLLNNREGLDSLSLSSLITLFHGRDFSKVLSHKDKMSQH